MVSCDICFLQIIITKTGTCHKWLFSPKGTAFLWASADNQDAVKPVVTATASNAGFVPDFLFQGTRDETAFCCVPTALTLYRGLGVDRIYEHNSRLVEVASQNLATAWNSEILAPPSLRGAFMAAVRLPLPFGNSMSSGNSGEIANNTYGLSAASAAAAVESSSATVDRWMLSPLGHEVLHDLLQSDYQIEYVKLFNFGKRVWVRIACQIYNEIEDYVRLGEAVLAVIRGGTYMKELRERAGRKKDNEEELQDSENWDGNFY